VATSKGEKVKGRERYGRRGDGREGKGRGKAPLTLWHGAPNPMS